VLEPKRGPKRRNLKSKGLPKAANQSVAVPSANSESEVPDEANQVQSTTSPSTAETLEGDATHRLPTTPQDGRGEKRFEVYLTGIPADLTVESLIEGLNDKGFGEIKRLKRATRNMNVGFLELADEETQERFLQASPLNVVGFELQIEPVRFPARPQYAGKQRFGKRRKFVPRTSRSTGEGENGVGSLPQSVPGESVGGQVGNDLEQK
ncbi:hypothetical protein HDU93_000519, partial [Gonapodya sp. JEL0774]